MTVGRAAATSSVRCLKPSAGVPKPARASPHTVSPLQPRLRSVILRPAKRLEQPGFPISVALFAFDQRAAESTTRSPSTSSNLPAAGGCAGGSAECAIVKEQAANSENVQRPIRRPARRGDCPPAPRATSLEGGRGKTENPFFHRNFGEMAAHSV